MASELDRLPTEFSRVASDERISSAVAALEANGVGAFVVESGAEARSLVRSLLPEGAEVYNNTSRTLEAIGVADDIERSGRYQPRRPRLYRMDREMQTTECGSGRRTASASALERTMVGSAHGSPRRCA